MVERSIRKEWPLPSPRLRVGVVGCGLIAQVMHLPHLLRLPELFEVVAICDLSPSLVEAVGRRFGVERRSTTWEDLLAEPLDAVLVLTSGDHAPIALAAAESGRHVFVEKPLCLTIEDGRAIVEAARRGSTRVMVGYMKRHDPAFLRLREELARTNDLRLATGLTLESPEAPYFEHHRLLRPNGPEPDVEAEIAALREQEGRRIKEALGTGDASAVHAYGSILLVSMIHDLDLVRGALGEPSRLEFAHIRDEGVTAVLRFGAPLCTLSWVALPGITRYRQEFAFYGPERRAKLVFSSPYLRNMPTTLLLEEGEPGTPRSWERSEVSSFDEAFERELLEFHAAIVEERDPSPGAEDGLRDVALCAAIVRSHLDRRPIDRPTTLPSEV